MVYSLAEKMDLFEKLLLRLNEIAPFKVIPMVGHYNMRGFNQLMLEKTGFINSVSFRDKATTHGPKSCVVGAAGACDAALVIGSDPLSALPFGTARALLRAPIIAIDPRRSLTTDAAQVVIPSAITGLEAGGTAIRMDGVKIKFDPILKSEQVTDEQILSRIIEAI
jgi:formylmethanofuran dehydrogenase subunit B